METTLATQKKIGIYKDLVEDFLKNSKIKVSDEEKKKFLMLCAVNDLNPRKKEVYAIPYGDKLTLVIGYNVFLQRAEATGLVAGWNILMKKEAGKLISGKITIHRKDWKVPFEYELDLVDAQNDKNPLWKSKTEDMMRKQLIRIGFGSAFPQVAPVSDPDDLTEDQFYSKIPKTEATVVEDLPPAKDFVDYLLSFLPDDYIPEGFEGGPSDDQIDDYVKTLQVEIGRKAIKDMTIVLDKEDIQKIFIGDDKNVVAMKKEAIKLLTNGK